MRAETTSRETSSSLYRFCCSEASGLCSFVSGLCVRQRLQAGRLLPVSTVSVAVRPQDCVYKGRDYKHGDFFQSLLFLLQRRLRILCTSREMSLPRDYKQGDFFQSLQFLLQ